MHRMHLRQRPGPRLAFVPIATYNRRRPAFDAIDAILQSDWMIRTDDMREMLSYLDEVPLGHIDRHYLVYLTVVAGIRFDAQGTYPSFHKTLEGRLHHLRDAATPVIAAKARVLLAGWK